MAKTGDLRFNIHAARILYVAVVILLPIISIYLMYLWSNTGMGASFAEMEDEQERLRETARFDLEEDLRNDLLMIAMTTAVSVDPVLVDEAIRYGNDGSRPYLELKGKLRAIMALDPMIDDIYIMIRGPDPDRFLFLACAYDTTDINGDGDITEDELAPAMFEEYYIGDKPDMKRSFDGPCIDTEIITDRWGSFISAYAPIKDVNGTAIAIVGVDYTSTKIDERVAILMSSYDQGMLRLGEGHEQTHRKMDIIALLFVILSMAIGIGISTLIFNRTERTLRNEIEKRTDMVRNSEERLRKVFEHSTDGMVTLDDAGNITSCNTAMMVMGGGGCGLKGQNLKELSGELPETISRMRDRLNRIKMGERVEPYVVKVSDTKDEERWVRVRCDGIGSIEGSTEHLFMVTDISLERHAYEMISRSERRYRAIIENSMDNIYICDARTGKVIESNRSIQNLLGYSDIEMRQLTAFDFLDHKDDDVKEHIGMVVKQGKSRIKRRRYRRKDGSLIEIEATCSLIKENGSDLICVVSRDMTERDDYERQLMEQRNRAELYLDILGHDIGNLHHGIMGFVAMCRLTESDPRRIRTYIDSIDALTNRSVHLVENVMILNRLQSVVPDLSGTDIESIIRSSVDAVRKSFPTREIRFEIRAGSIPPVKGFRAIESVFYNLIHNAVKYQVEGTPVVEIDMMSTGDATVLIGIRDRGPGIPSYRREKIFNRASLDRKQGGIGLSLVKILLEKCGGRVWINDPKNGGSGTVFMVEMPVFM